jgi:hypothetical protein
VLQDSKLLDVAFVTQYALLNSETMEPIVLNQVLMEEEVVIHGNLVIKPLIMMEPEEDVKMTTDKEIVNKMVLSIILNVEPISMLLDAVFVLLTVLLDYLILVFLVKNKLMVEV